MMIESVLSTFDAMPTTHDRLTPIGLLTCEAEGGWSHHQRCRFKLSDTQCLAGGAAMRAAAKSTKPAGYEWPLWRDPITRTAPKVPTTPIVRAWLTASKRAHRAVVPCSDQRMERIAAWYAEAMGAQTESAVAA